MPDNEVMILGEKWDEYEGFAWDREEEVDLDWVREEQ